MKKISMSLAGLLTCAVAAVGCSSGGGGGGGSASTSAPLSSNSSLASQLPQERRDTAGYTYGSTQNNTIRGGQVTALGISPTGTATFAGHFPLAQVDQIDNGQVTLSGNLFYDASSFATVGTATFAATANASRGGAGDVHAFVNGAWSRVIDTPDAEAIVASVNSDIYAAHGGVGARGTVKLLNRTTNTWVDVAGLDSSIPTAAAGLKGELFVGATRNGAQGGPARLFRVTAGKASEIQVPGAQGGFNVRQEISAMISVAPSTSGSIATTGSASVAPASSGVIVLGIASIDVATGAPTGGAILVTDGVSFEELHRWTDDAPAALALHDNTIFVGTVKGQLMRRAPTGTFVAEPNFPAVTSVVCLLSRDSATLFVGAKGTTGAQTVRRSGNTGSVGPTPVNTDRFYRPDVKAVLVAKCASCHATPGLPVAVTAFGLSANLANDTADNTATRAKVNLTTPASSLLLTKALGQQNHLGGAVLTTSSPEYGVLLAWIQQGARFEKTTTPPPATPKTYVADVKPILAAKNCTSCHLASNPYLLSAGLANNAADFAATMSRINTTTPEQSLFLRKVAQSSNTVHGGGTLIAQNSPEYATLLLWIQQGARMQ